VDPDFGFEPDYHACTEFTTAPNKCLVSNSKNEERMRRSLNSAHAHTMVSPFTLFAVLQWLTLKNGLQVAGSVLMVNDKPQAILYTVSCTSDKYNMSPIYMRINYFRNDIITAAEGNVDNQ
jgi:hypothetical protein